MKTLRNVRMTVQMRDAAMRDTIVTPPTEKEWAAYLASQSKTDLGRIWTGTLKSTLDSLDEEVVDSMLMDLAKYVSARPRKRSPAQSTSDKPNPTSDGALIESINEANKRFWDQRA